MQHYEIVATYVLPGDVLLGQRLEDGCSAGSSGHIVPKSGRLVGVVNKAARRSRSRKLAINIGWAGVLSELYKISTVSRVSPTCQATYIRIKESKVLCQLSQKSSLLLIVGHDDKRGITGSLAVLIGLALNEATHIRSVIVGRVPLAEDLVAGTSKVVIRILQRHLSLVRSCADIQWLVPDSPVGVGVLIAESTVAQVVNIRVEVPVTSNVIERVVLERQVDNVLDLCEDKVSKVPWYI